MWLYLALIILGRTTAFLNSYATFNNKNPMKGNVRANPFIYKVIGKNAPKNVSVVFEEDGDAGKYNRVNRSVHHMIENVSNGAIFRCEMMSQLESSKEYL